MLSATRFGLTTCSTKYVRWRILAICPGAGSEAVSLIEIRPTFLGVSYITWFSSSYSSASEAASAALQGLGVGTGDSC